MLETRKGLDLIKKLPHERLLTETDGPFIQLANKTIRPRDVNEIVNLLAEIKEMPPNVIAEVILSNQTTLIEKYRPNK